MVRPLPVTTVKTPGGTPLDSRTLATIFAVARVIREVEDAPFQMWVLPQARLNARFHPSTALQSGGERGTKISEK